MTTQDIRFKAKQARQGDKNALSALQKRYIKVVKQANERLLRLEKSGFESEAYKIAMREIMSIHPTKSGRYTTRIKNIDTTELEHLLISAERFLVFQTSQVAGQKKFLTNTIKSIRAKGINITNSQQMLDLMTSDFFAEFIQYDSEEALKTFADMANEGITLKDVKRLYDQYLTNKLDWIDITQDWEDITNAQKNKRRNKSKRKKRNRR